MRMTSSGTISSLEPTSIKLILNTSLTCGSTAVVEIIQQGLFIFTLAYLFVARLFGSRCLEL